MVNKERVKKLVEALRSGKYKQTKEVLRDKNGFCCLGVACDIAKMEVGCNWTPFSLEFDGDDRALSDGMQTYYGFDDCEVVLDDDLPFTKGIINKYVVPNTLVTLAALNDYGASFKEIAKVIEEQFLTEAK